MQPKPKQPSMVPPGGRPAPVPNKWAALNEDDDDDEPPPVRKESGSRWTDAEWQDWKDQQWKDQQWKDGWASSSSWKDKDKWWEKDWGRQGGDEEGNGQGGKRWSDAKENDKGGSKGRWEWQEDDSPERWGETWEQPREETGVQLIGEIAPESAEWEYILMDESRRCFAAFLPCPFDEAQCASFFQRVKEGTDWKQPQTIFGGTVPRKTA
ncbi:eml4, partial [Symbiodinium natans]